ARDRIQSLLDQDGQHRINEVRQAYQDCMTDHCGVFRTESVMEEGLEQLRQVQKKASQIYLDDKGTQWNTEILEALELQSLMTVGEVILTAALNRQESRGAHCREDYPERDDANFLKHTLAYHSAAGVDLAYMPVSITQFEPKERKY
ncbi:MAG: hypothetical protein WBA57_24355, partial [Elainellaceae cyanobacterium]